MDKSAGDIMEEKTLPLASLVFPIKAGKILLGMKGAKIGIGCWNGYGGGVERNETLEECALRELSEECGLSGKLEDLTKIAVVDFHNTKSDESTFVCRVHVYTLRNPIGQARETETMLRPAWFPIDKLPLTEMMPADIFWLPLALAGKQIYARAFYGPYQKRLLQPVEILPLSKFEE